MLILIALACQTGESNTPTAPHPPTPDGPVTGFEPNGDGFVAHHPPMGTTATATSDGLGFAGADWNLTLRPLSIGRTDETTPIELHAPDLRADRVVLASNPTLWATHDERGLEFGFDVEDRPVGHGDLQIRLGMDGLNMPWSTGTDVSFDAGSTLVRIDDVLAWDANGDELDATLRADCGDPETDTAGPCVLVIEVADELALYPVIIDPLLTAAAPVISANIAPTDQLVITELMINPTLVFDNRGEYIELTNIGSNTVDLSGLAVWDDGSNYFKIPATGPTLAPGATFVLGRNNNLAQNGGVPVDFVMSNFFLANNVSNVNPDEVVIGIRATSAPCSVSNPCTELDRVTMNGSWNHQIPGVGTFLPAGAALSLDPTMLSGDNNVRSAWCDGISPYGTGHFGTPNQPNESCGFTLPFDYAFELIGGSTVGNCVALNLALDGTMTTNNSGDGSYLRYTRSTGQTLQWNYTYNGPQPTNPTIYRGVRPIGAPSWTNGQIINFDPAIAVDGLWVSPCVPVDTGDTGTADPGTLLFTQYLEGSGNNKYLEIQNKAATTQSLSGCEVNIYFNGSNSAGQTIPLGLGSLAPDALLSMCHTSAVLPIGAPPCDITGSFSFNGNDAVELVCSGSTVDVIGRIGENPGSFWGTSPLDTMDANLQRSCTVFAGDPIGSDPFDPATEWSTDTPEDASDIGLRTCP